MLIIIVYCILNSYSSYYCANIKRDYWLIIFTVLFVPVKFLILNYEAIISLSFVFSYIMLKNNKIKF